MKQIAWILVACAGVLVAGCGQKGPLFLPDKNASVVTRPGGGAAAPATTPAPGDAAPAATPKQPQDKSGDDSTGATAPK